MEKAVKTLLGEETYNLLSEIDKLEGDAFTEKVAALDYSDLLDKTTKANLSLKGALDRKVTGAYRQASIKTTLDTLEGLGHDVSQYRADFKEGKLDQDRLMNVVDTIKASAKKQLEELSAKGSSVDVEKLRKEIEAGVKESIIAEETAKALERENSIKSEYQKKIEAIEYEKSIDAHVGNALLTREVLLDPQDMRDILKRRLSEVVIKGDEIYQLDGQPLLDSLKKKVLTVREYLEPSIAKYEKKKIEAQEVKVENSGSNGTFKIPSW